MVALIDKFQNRAKVNFNSFKPRTYKERNTPKLASLAERIIALENENRRLKQFVNSHNSPHTYSGLVPEDTLDLALFISVSVLIIYLGKTLWK